MKLFGMAWKRRSETLQSLCYLYVKTFCCFFIFSWFVCDKDTGCVCLAVVKWSDGKRAEGLL